MVTVGGLAGTAMVGCSSAPPAPPAAPDSAPAAAGTSAPATRTFPAGAKVPILTGKAIDGGIFYEGTSGGVASEFDAHTALTSQQWRNSGELAILPPGSVDR